MIRQASPAIQSLCSALRGVRLQLRSLTTLAIETSCDDTAVAILETKSRDETLNGPPRSDSFPMVVNVPLPLEAKLLFNERITADNSRYGGIHPLVALESHQRNLAKLVQRGIAAVSKLDISRRTETQSWSPDLIAVTRGPGMRSNLATGIDFAKGLSVAWGLPIVGVHHMQAHLLTPRMVAALDTGATEQPAADLEFPFLSLLVSGGHTMLLLSKSLNDHELLADTDLPLGQALDKLARLILPQQVLDEADSTMYGAALEKFSFSDLPACGHEYTPPRNRAGGYYNSPKPATRTWPWSLAVPLAEADGGIKRQSLEYSFSGTLSAVERIMKFDQSPDVSRGTLRTQEMPLEERRALAQESMRVCFEHLTSRVLLALDSINQPIKTVVASGGVASNHFLRNILSSWLSAFGYPDICVNCPPPKYCTDNAAMIAWAGVEIFEAGWRSDLGFTARRKWALGMHTNSPSHADSKGQGESDATSILDVDSWYNVLGQQTNYAKVARPWPNHTGCKTQGKKRYGIPSATLI